MTTTIATLFSGGELVGVGARSAGFEHAWGIEVNDEIAQAARVNGFHVVSADVTTERPGDYERPDLLHASPPCPNFSQAKTGSAETREDIELAQATVRFIETLLPRWFTLENVPMYRFSESWRLILDALNWCGYWTNVQNHLNAADFGVPQTRKRMIVRAVRGGWLPPLPQPVPWVGWYQAIEDLVPGLPDSEFAPWQLARMPGELRGSLLVDSAGYPGDDGVRVPVMRALGEPANTIVANFERRPMRAFIVDTQNGGQPTPTIRDADAPTFTVTANCATNGMPRVFIVSGQSGDDGNRLTIRHVGEPSFVVSSSEIKRPVRAAVAGRIVKMTPRCLARFQSIPDDYVLHDDDTLAVRIVGNAVPPLLYRRLVEGLVTS